MRYHRCPGGLCARLRKQTHGETFQPHPQLIVEGRKGGSNLAATLVNAILTFDDAEQLKPGRDV